MSSILTIPPTNTNDVERAKDFLFAIYGEGGWTESAYLELSDRINYLIEFSDERLIVLPMPTYDHQTIVLILGRLFQDWARLHGGRAFISPYPVRLTSGKFREPDVMLYCADHLDRITKQYGGIPDLIVEVLSPSTKGIDLDEKKSEYAQAGVSEYWIVDSESTHIEQYVLDNDAYRLHATLGTGDTLRAVTLEDLEMSVEKIYTA